MSSEADDEASTPEKMDKGKGILDEIPEQTEIATDDETNDETVEEASTSIKVNMERSKLNEICAAVNTIPTQTELEAEEILSNLLMMDTGDGRLIADFDRKNHYLVKDMKKVDKVGKSPSLSDVFLWLTRILFTQIVDVYAKDGSVYSGFFYSILENGTLLSFSIVHFFIFFSSGKIGFCIHPL